MSKDLGFIPNDHTTPEQYAVVNREDWTITIYDRKEESFTDMDVIEDVKYMVDEVLTIEKSLQNLSIDAECNMSDDSDEDIDIESPFAKKVKCSTPFNKEHISLRPEEKDSALSEITAMLPYVLNELKRNGHLETWVNLNRLIAEKKFCLTT